jgi:hypothetical protein
MPPQQLMHALDAVALPFGCERRSGPHHHGVGDGKRARAASSRLRRHRHATQAPALYGQPGRRRPTFAATTIRSR